MNTITITNTNLKPVDLDFMSNVDGNIFAILAVWKGKARKAGYTFHDIKRVLDDAMSGDYDHALRVILSTGD